VCSSLVAILVFMSAKSSHPTSQVTRRSLTKGVQFTVVASQQDSRCPTPPRPPRPCDRARGLSGWCMVTDTGVRVGDTPRRSGGKHTNWCLLNPELIERAAAVHLQSFHHRRCDRNIQNVPKCLRPFTWALAISTWPAHLIITH
jgi:hypothetical protein